MSGRRVLLGLLTTVLVGCASTAVYYPAEPVATEVAEDTEADQDVEDVSVFYDALAPYGNWVAVPEYGQVWVPHNVPAGWRPYTHGRWVYSDYGWTWASHWDWGWAPFHYGRWSYVSAYGWVWIPGTVWAPAWVAWRYGPGWVGWAPLPYGAALRPGGVVTQVEIIPHFWFSFVEERWLVQPHIHTYLAPPARSVTLVHVTHNVTNYRIVHRRVVNHCIPVQRIERVTTHPIPRLRVVRHDTSTGSPRTIVRDREREVVVYRPPAGTARQRVESITRHTLPPGQPRTAPPAQEQTEPSPTPPPVRNQPATSQPQQLSPAQTPERPRQSPGTRPRNRREQENAEDTTTSRQPTARQPQRPPSADLAEPPRQRRLVPSQEHKEREPRSLQGAGQPPGQQQSVPPAASPQPQRQSVAPRQPRYRSEPPATAPSTPSPPPSAPAQRSYRSTPAGPPPSSQPVYGSQNTPPSAQQQPRRTQRYGQPDSQYLQQQ